MKKIPPEIDSLMWAVAEAADPAAIDDFEARHPEHRYELGKRLAMVRALKGSKPSDSALISRRFRPTPAARPAYGRWSWVPAAAALSALAAAAYFGGLHYFAPVASKPQNTVESSAVNQPERFNNSGATYEYRPEPTPQPNSNGGTHSQPENPPVQVESLYTVQLEDLGLTDALQSIGLQCALDLQIAPGFQNPKITVDYRDLPAEAILSDLGRKYGFTALKQGPREYLLIPAVDRNAAPVGQPKDENSRVGVDSRRDQRTPSDEDGEY